MAEPTRHRLSPEQRAALTGYSTGQICDAMEALDLPRAVILGLRMVAAPGQRIAGTAVTLRQVLKTEADDPKAGMVSHSRLSGGLAGPGDVVVIDVGGHVASCSWGEVHSRRSQRNGVAGALIHGAVRDVAEILESGFPIACRGFSPVKSRWQLKTETIQAPVVIDGVTIAPGDVVCADETGVVIVPVGAVTAVLAQCAAIVVEEARLEHLSDWSKG